MHTTVDMSSSRRLATCASAQAPATGPRNITIAYDTESAAVQANVAHGSLPAMTDTK